MAPDKDPSGSAALHSSTDTSPMDTRAPPARFESITRGDEEDASITTGTIRGNRPPAISTDFGTYGTLTC